VLEYQLSELSPTYVLDHFSVPDFAAGAMENWGLITYREDRLAYSSITDSVYQKERVALIVAHEIAHQWFGNLVTITWFSDLWITEGLAQYLQFVAIDTIESSWNVVSY
jgi:aminopeptidase N